MNENLIEIAKRLKKEGMQCNCDLDRWEPEKSTGHSFVCRIHQQAHLQYSGGTEVIPDDNLTQLSRARKDRLSRHQLKITQLTF